MTMQYNNTQLRVSLIFVTNFEMFVYNWMSPFIFEMFVYNWMSPFIFEMFVYNWMSLHLLLNYIVMLIFDPF